MDRKILQNILNLNNTMDPHDMAMEVDDPEIYVDSNQEVDSSNKENEFVNNENANMSFGGLERIEISKAVTPPTSTRLSILKQFDPFYSDSPVPVGTKYSSGLQQANGISVENDLKQAAVSENIVRSRQLVVIEEDQFREFDKSDEEKDDASEIVESVDNSRENQKIVKDVESESVIIIDQSGKVHESAEEPLKSSETDSIGNSKENGIVIVEEEKDVDTAEENKERAVREDSFEVNESLCETGNSSGDVSVNQTIVGKRIEDKPDFDSDVKDSEEIPEKEASNQVDVESEDAPEVPQSNNELQRDSVDGEHEISTSSFVNQDSVQISGTGSKETGTPKLSDEFGEKDLKKLSDTSSAVTSSQLVDIGERFSSPHTVPQAMADETITIQLRQKDEVIAKLQAEVTSLKAQNTKLSNELNSTNEVFQKCTQEYDKSIAAKYDELTNLKKEGEVAKRHLSTLEVAFSDLLQKYDRCKTIIEGFKSNEEILKEHVAVGEENLRKNDEKYEALKAHAKAQLEKCNLEIIKTRDGYEMEITKLTTIIKRLEIKVESLNNALEQKKKECTSLAALFDEMTGKV